MERDKVVGVHDRVDEAVENYGQVHIAVVSNVEIQPVELQHKQRHQYRKKYIKDDSFHNIA